MILQGFLGSFVVVDVAWVTSEGRCAIPWRVAPVGLAL
jgi:hypothetical protein